MAKVSFKKVAGDGKCMFVVLTLLQENNEIQHTALRLERDGSKNLGCGWDGKVISQKAENETKLRKTKGK